MWNGMISGMAGRWRKLAVVVLGLALLAGPVVAGDDAQARKDERKIDVLVSNVKGEPGGGSFLGVGVREVTAELARRIQLPEERGVEITSIVPGSAAAEAGVEKGDVVTGYNGTPVEGVTQFMRLVRETPVGRRVTLTIIRNGAERNVEATMGEKKGWAWVQQGGKPFDAPGPEMWKMRLPDMPRIVSAWKTSALGVVGEGLEGQLASYFGVEEGVLVRSVGEDTPAQAAGLRAGDVIITVAGNEVATPQEISNAIRESDSRNVEVILMRDRQRMTATVMLEDGREDR